VACRVRIRLSTDKAVETSALVNSGFESDDPDVVIPVELARRLNLWPPHPNSELAGDRWRGCDSSILCSCSFT
jgi:hypothetical protein